MSLFGPPNIEKLKGKHDVQGLIKALGYKNKDVRMKAAKALDFIGWRPGQDEKGAAYWIAKEEWSECIKIGRSAVEPLIAALKYEDSDGYVYVCLPAVKALGQLKDPRSVGPLIKVLKESESMEEVHLATANALIMIGAPAFQALIAELDRVNYDERMAAAKRLAFIGAPAAEPLIAAFKNNDGDVNARRSAVQTALELIGAPAVEPLIAALKDSEGIVRGYLASTLRLIGVPAVKPLISALKDSDKHTRMDITEALVFIGAPALEPLIDSLKDNDKDVCLNAGMALGGAIALEARKDPRVVEPLIAVLKDIDKDVRRAAAIAFAGVLGRFKAPRLVNPLITALKDSDKDKTWNTQMAIDAATQLGTTIAEEAIKDPDTVEQVIVSLKDIDKYVRMVTTSAFATKLGEFKVPRIVKPLIAALDNSDEYVRRAAAEALGALEDFRAVDPLIATLKDSDEYVRRTAAKALGALKDRRAVEWLTAALKDSDKNVRCEAAEALGQLKDPRAVEPLIAALKDSEGIVRRDAAWALYDLEDPRAVEPLIAALMDSHKEVREIAAQALGGLKDLRAITPLIDVLKDSDELVRKAAEKALDRIDPSASQLSRSAEQPTPTTKTTKPLALRLVDSAHPACKQLERVVKIVDQYVQVELVGERTATKISAPIGEMERADSILDEAIAICPDDMDLVVAKASVLHASAQFKSAEEVLNMVLSKVSDHFEAKMWKSHWETWSDALRFPKWDERLSSFHPVMATHLRLDHRVQIVRDGIQKTLAIVTSVKGPPFDSRTQIKVEWVLSKTSYGPLVAYYLKIIEPSGEPSTMEAFLPIFQPTLFSPMESYFLVQQLAFTPYCFVVLVSGNSVLLNRRILFGQKTTQKVRDMAAQLASTQSYLSQPQFKSAVQWHMNNFDMNRLTFE